MSNPTFSQWQEAAKQLTIHSQAFINGHYKASISNETFDCISPIDGRKLAQVASCDEADVELAVQSARSAFTKGIWSEASPAERKTVLTQFAKLLHEHQSELALLETLDMGKPIQDSLSVDLPASIHCLNWYAEAIDKVYGEVAPTEGNRLGLVTREPVGVVAAIVPWNFPLLMACWKIAPALAAGNSVILKPSEKSPLTAIAIAELASQAGLPDGVFNVLPGFGHKVGKALALHKDVDTLAFTGSTRTAKQLLIYAGQSNMKRVWIEAGGKSPHIVFADAPDLDKVAQAAAAAICFNQGEVCTAGSRLLVENSIEAEFREKVIAAIKTWQPGNPLNPETTLGAIVDKTQLDTVLSYIEAGKNNGAKLVWGGKQLHQKTGGLYIEPTVFAEVDNRMKIAQEEIFGPVLSIIPFSTEEQAISIANDTNYGLAAAVWSQNLGRAHRVAKALRAGSVWVNQYDGGDMNAPFGGYKQSGNGRDKSLHALEKYTELKATWIALD